MERRSFLGALTAASLGVVLEGSFTECAPAQNTAQGVASAGQATKIGDFPRNSTIMLVHAAWADGYCWSNIVLPLERRGLKVICAPIPLTSLTSDATALSVALERTSGPGGTRLFGRRNRRGEGRAGQVASLRRGAGAGRGRDGCEGLLSRHTESGSTQDGSRFPRPCMDARRRVPPGARTEGVARSGKDRGILATPDFSSLHSRAGTDATLEIKAVVVLGRRRRPHDQS
jgi:hypothetical protein